MSRDHREINDQSTSILICDFGDLLSNAEQQANQGNLDPDKWCINFNATNANNVNHTTTNTTIDILEFQQQWSIDQSYRMDGTSEPSSSQNSLYPAANPNDVLTPITSSPTMVFRQNKRTFSGPSTSLTPMKSKALVLSQPYPLIQSNSDTPSSASYSSGTSTVNSMTTIIPAHTKMPYDVPRGVKSSAIKQYRERPKMTGRERQRELERQEAHQLQMREYYKHTIKELEQKCTKLREILRHLVLSSPMYNDQVIGQLNSLDLFKQEKNLVSQNQGH